MFKTISLEFQDTNSKYLLLDNGITILGTVASILCLMRFKEYTFLQILCNFVSLITFLIMPGEDHSRIIWVINSLNAIISTGIAEGSCLDRLRIRKILKSEIQ